MASRGGGRENARVVLIDTQYVVTDSTSFKSVVQSLTSKDSCVGWIEESSFNGNGKKRVVAADGSQGRFDHSNLGNIEGTAGGTVGDRRLSKGSSLKDLDGLMLESPSLEEWQQLLLHSNLV